MADTTDLCRVVHHSTRVAFPLDRGKARLYFSRLREGYDQFYCWNRWRDDLYRSEMDFYCKHYDAWIAAKNLVAAKNRHKERTVTVCGLHGKARTCPEELTVQLTVENDGQLPDQRTFRSCVQAAQERLDAVLAEEQQELMRMTALCEGPGGDGNGIRPLMSRADAAWLQSHGYRRNRRRRRRR